MTALNVKRVPAPGLHGDGGGPHLQVTGKGAKSWLFRFMVGGRARAMGLGSLTALNLADARAKAAECRRLRSEGVDPIDPTGLDGRSPVARQLKALQRKAAERSVEGLGQADQCRVSRGRRGWSGRR